MSDLYGTDDHSSFEQPQSHEQPPEDMSVFLHNLLQNSPAETAAGAGQSMMIDYRRSVSIINSSSAASLDFSDPGGFFGKERVERTFSSAGGGGGDFDAVTSSMNIGEGSNANKELEASDSGGNQGQARSSKRTRSAEVHNLSEKRRRSKINEKLKALQTLIPNSNKTDKASMLDEAIEYLKQLQLQVQMLTVRNGFSLHPTNYVPGYLPPMQLPVQFDEGSAAPNSSRGAEIVSGNQEVVMQNMFGTNHPKDSSHQLLEPSTINNSSSRTPFGLESSFPSHYGLLNHLASAKDICRDDTLAHLPLNISCSGNNSSSGVSS